MQVYTWDSRVGLPSNWFCKPSKDRRRSMNKRRDIRPPCEIKSHHREAHLRRRYIIWRKLAFVRRSHAPFGRHINDLWSWEKRSPSIFLNRTRPKNKFLACITKSLSIMSLITVTSLTKSFGAIDLF